MYPTKEEILKEPRPQYRLGLMRAVSEWKTEYYKWWNSVHPDDKEWALQMLADRICEAYNENPVTVEITGGPNRYEPVGRNIFLRDGSIISLFHELAHHLFGKDELTACRWSVWLYQLRFRNDYKKLVWDEHLLVRRSSLRATGKLRSKIRAVSSALPVKRKGGK